MHNPLGYTSEEQTEVLIDAFLNYRELFEKTLFNRYPAESALALRTIMEECSDSVASKEAEEFIKNILPSEELSKRIRNYNIANTATFFGACGGLYLSTEVKGSAIEIPLFLASCGIFLTHCGLNLLMQKKVSNYSKQYVFKEALEHPTEEL